MYICMYILSPPRVRVAWDDEGRLHTHKYMPMLVFCDEGRLHTHRYMYMHAYCMHVWIHNKPTILIYV